MTHIEWVKNPDGTQGITWNPITGCLNHVNGLCKGGGFPCYAYKLAHTRLKQRYLANSNLTPCGHGSQNSVCITTEDKNDPFYPRFWEERLYHPLGIKPKGIFVCDMGDLFGIGVPEHWTNKVLEELACCPEHRFYLLTKQPQNLIKFSPFPENCFVGVTLTDFNGATHKLADFLLVKATLKFLSLEPLLARFPAMAINKDWFQWLIIGACTGTWYDIFQLSLRYPGLTMMRLNKRLYTLQPRIEWVQEIVEAADKAGVKVFLKDNLKPLIQEAGHSQASWAAKEWVQCKYPVLRQELPE